MDPLATGSSSPGGRISLAFPPDLQYPLYNFLASPHHMKSDGDGPGGLLAELKRRHVFRIGVAYAVAAFALLQVGDLVAEPLNLPEWTLAFLIVLLALGFPVALILAWALEVTPDGVRRTPRGTAEEGAARATSPARASERWKSVPLLSVGILIPLVAIGAYIQWDRGRIGSLTSPGAVPTQDDRSIAVLPFDNLSADEDNGYFAAGVHEDILTQLSMVDGLTVISRTSVMQYSGTEETIPEIAMALGVRYVVEGSVRRSDEGVRITAQLIDGRTDEHLWAHQYDRELEDVFAVQSEVAKSISRAMNLTLTPSLSSRIETRPTNNQAAYDLYLRGRELQRGDIGNNAASVELLKQAIQLDSTFADAYAHLGFAYYERAQSHGYPIAWADSGATAARHAIALDPTLPTAYLYLGYNLEVRGLLHAASEAYRRALDLRPSYAEALGGLGSVERLRGRYAEAVGLYERAAALNPMEMVHPWNVGVTYMLMADDVKAELWIDRAAEREGREGRGTWVEIARVWQAAAKGEVEEAYERAQRAAQTHPNDFLIAWTLGGAALLSERWVEGERVLGELYRQAPEAKAFGRLRSLRSDYAMALYRTGETVEAKELLSLALERARALVVAGNELPDVSLEIAAIHTVQGDVQAAYDWLDRAYVAGDRYYRGLRTDPAFQTLMGEPRFSALLEQMEGDVRRMRARLEATDQ